MKLICPSCAASHETNDYPGAFEIQCECGYSLLVPAEEAPQNLSAPNDDPLFVARVPTAMEAEDEALALKPDSGESSLDSDVVNILTNSDESEPLPEGMIYDSFDLSKSETSFESTPEVNSPSTMHLGNVIERSQLASMGQFLGQDFNLKITNLTREKLIEVLHRGEELLRDRPWLETELERRGLNLTELVDTSRINRVPELIAVEIYLAVRELGGDCDFRVAT